MKKLIVPMLVTLSAPAFAGDYFTELRLGVQDTYAKKVNHATKGVLAGDFKGINYGLRLGKTFGMHSVFLEYNPEQDVEIKSADELAKVQSTFIGYRYHLAPTYYVGAQIGQSSFELEKGPNGVTFDDNPMTEGMTYGINAGYKKEFGNLYISGDLAYNLGSYKEDGPSTTPVEDIEIQSQYQINFNIGMNF